MEMMKTPEKINDFEYCYTDPVAQFLLKKIATYLNILN